MTAATLIVPYGVLIGFPANEPLLLAGRAEAFGGLPPLVGVGPRPPSEGDGRPGPIPASADLGAPAECDLKDSVNIRPRAVDTSAMVTLIMPNSRLLRSQVERL
jgi:hypothetical protein